MDVKALEIPDVKLVKPKVFHDDRGFFSETYNKRAFADAGLDVEFVQDNHSLSRERGVIRGLHYQIPPHAQDKLVRVIRGSVFDVAVDIRWGSPTFGRHVAVVLSAENGCQVWVPKGFAHGFCTLEPNTEVVYKVTDLYAADCDKGIAWDDPALGIQWPIAARSVVVSGKDSKHPRLSELEIRFDDAG